MIITIVNIIAGVFLLALVTALLVEYAWNLWRRWRR